MQVKLATLAFLVAGYLEIAWQMDRPVLCRLDRLVVAPLATFRAAERYGRVAIRYGSNSLVKVTEVPKTTKHLATLTYSYFVDEFRSGTYDREFSREADADQFAREVKDRAIQVRYKSANPDVSCPEASEIEQMALAASSLRPEGSSLSRIAGRFRSNK